MLISFAWEHQADVLRIAYSFTFTLTVSSGIFTLINKAVSRNKYQPYCGQATQPNG
jgi:hypothetical protein